MAKQKRTKAKEYNKIFEEWRQERLQKEDYIVKSRKQRDGSIKTYEFTKEELLSVKQCYAYKSGSKYAKAREGLVPYWFISDKGTLITCFYKNEGVLYVPPSFVGEKRKKGEGIRQQYEMSNGKNGKRKFDPAILVALTFDGKATESAERLLKKKGLKALKEVQLNHEEGYKHGKTDEEVEANRPYNCDIRRTQFETVAEHELLTHQKARDISDFARVLSGDNIKMAILDDDHAGTIAESVKIGHKDGTITATYNNGLEEKSVDIKEFKEVLVHNRYHATVILMNEDLTEFIRRGEDLPEEIYDEAILFVREILPDLTEQNNNEIPFGMPIPLNSQETGTIHAVVIRRDETVAE